MEREEILSRLNSIFRNQFDDDDIVLNDESTAKDIEGWNSLEHITLLGGIEREFRIKFTISEVNQMRKVGDIINTIICKKNHDHTV